jgi:hypothetical protein
MSRKPLVTSCGPGLEIAHQELEALLGDRRGGRDIDHERHLALLAHLRDRQRVAAVESADQDMRAVVDQALGLGARDVGVRFRVDMHEFHPVAEFGEHARCRQSAAMAALACLGQQARARQKHADAQGSGLRRHERRGGHCGRARGSPGQYGTARNACFECHWGGLPAHLQIDVRARMKPATRPSVKRGGTPDNRLHHATIRDGSLFILLIFHRCNRREDFA